MSNKMEELKKDIAELESLEKQAIRQKNKDILTIEIRKLISELTRLQEQTTRNTIASSGNVLASSGSRRYEVKLNNYAWDQNNKFVKFYITLENVHGLAPENIKCDFTHKHLELSIKDLNNKDYSFKISNLLKPIEPEQSNWKVKKDMIIINASKKEPVNWSHVTEWEKKSSDSKMPDHIDPDKNADPTESLMSLMKNMYDKGDDEMKRTIAKAWTEGQMKKPPI